ncbi:MAG: DUF5668 domain-containing protein [Rikenellaceae bacterium]|jgi:hypothetical protein|nr:DUF5668 domain-containing protein [Rikenellaceae bacterium]
MEVVNNNQPALGQKGGIISSRNIFLGGILILVGVVWLLKNFDVISYRVYDVFFSWEMLLTVIGLYLLTLHRWVAGGIVTVVGAGFLVTNVFGVDIPFEKVIFPLVFVTAGLGVLFSRGSR